jgi:hypothetical protein
MTFALDVVVTIRALKRLRANSQDAVVEHVNDVKAGEIAASVASTARFNKS